MSTSTPITEQKVDSTEHIKSEDKPMEAKPSEKTEHGDTAQPATS